ncbi:MAG: 6-phosphofructokinase [Bacteroidales bacterium]|jgi:6-phosphofructokinase 1|nr:6-phosphofructokinase [Bacteroidales bacterium]
MSEIKQKKTVAILCGGGPAPGINTVIGSVAKSFLRDGYRVLGIHRGFSGLLDSKRRTKEIFFAKADNIFKTGGSYLQMSRYKPKDEEFSTDFFVENNVKLLVTIGGDDTASTANRLTAFLRKHHINIQNIHVPKTIDNDLPLPPDQYTFGFVSAKEEACKLTTTIYEDARTSVNWFLISVMGREAGHLAFAVGAACHIPMIIIPEMFNKTQITVDKIIRLMISSMIKRKILGIDYGAVMLSEGVLHFLSDEDIINTGIHFEYDAHGHPELGIISKAHVFNVILMKKIEELNIPIKSRPVEIGYHVRCAAPSAYDKMYCSMLGMGVKQLFDAGKTGCMVTVDSVGNISPLFLEDVTVDGKILPRLVDMEQNKTKMVYSTNQQYLIETDYIAAKKYLPNPEEFDFFKILNWNSEYLKY